MSIAGTSKSARVREIETHGTEVQRSKLGHRTAINLVGVSPSELTRGDELVAPEAHSTARRLLVDMQMFRETQPLRCPATIQIHTATISCAARISGSRKLQAGERAVVVVETERDLVTTFAQQCLFRRPYPVGSFAGGRIVASLPATLRSKRSLRELGDRLLTESKTDRLVAWVEYLSELSCQPGWMETQLAIDQSECDDVIKDAVNQQRVIRLATDQRHLFSLSALQNARQYITKLLSSQAKETDDAWSVEDSVIQRARSTGSKQLIQLAIKQLVAEKQLVRLGKMIAVASDETRLSKKQRALIDEIVSLYQASRTPPTLKELAQQTGATVDSLGSLVRFLAQQDLLINLGNGFWYSTEVFGKLCGELRGLFDESPEQLVAAIRDHWRLTRKYVIPLLEYCDRVGVTTRVGDIRTAGPKIDHYLPEKFVEQD